MKFSIVIPVYNAKDYIENTVESIKNQGFEDYELILVEDCSKDSSREIVKKIAAADDRVKAVLKEQNEGPAKARNDGIKEATGEYIIFIDADDTIDEGFLKAVNKEIEAKEADVYVYGCTEEYYVNGKLDYKKSITPGCEYLDDEVKIREKVLELELITLLGYPWNKAYKLSIIKENNIEFPDVEMIEDFLFNVEFFKKVKALKTLDYMPYHYAIRGTTSVTATFRKNYFELHESRVKTLIDLYKSYEMFDSYRKNKIAGIYGRYLMSAIERNADKRSGMDKKAQEAWLEKAFETEVFNELREEMHSDAKLLSKIMEAFKNKDVKKSLKIGKTVYFVKTKFPGMFNKLKQNR